MVRVGGVGGCKGGGEYGDGGVGGAEGDNDGSGRVF